MVVLQPVLILFFMIGLGYVAQKTKLLSADIRGPLTSYVINLALPLFILHNMNFDFDRQILINSLAVLGMSVGTYIVMTLASVLYAKRSKLPPDKLPAYQFGMVFSNVGFMGYPLIAGLFGAEAVFYTAIFNIGFETFIWTYGVWVFQKGKISFKNLITPNLVALATGLILFLLNFRWPEVLANGIELVGRTATPLSMIVVGMMLAEVHLKDMINDIKPFMISAYRLVLVPALALAVYWLIGLRGLKLAVPVMLMATPIATYGAILASYYKKDFREATRLVIISTILSLITIPIWATIIIRLSGV